jgi:hypothetical protein
MGRLRRIAIDLFVMAALGALLGLWGPFGSDAMPPAKRLFFWVAFIVAGYAIFRPIAIVAQWVTEETRIPRWLAVVLTATLGALPLAALVAFALGGMTVTDQWFGNRFPILYGQVALVGISIHLLMMVLTRPPAVEAPQEPSAATEEEAPGESPFLRRLPPALGRDLLSLQMQDHYVFARTALGGAMVLMRFRDAVTELGGTGMQIHRSWWAAYHAMEALERSGRSARLRLSDGRVLPVSRAWVPAVRAALDRFDSQGRSSKSAPETGRDTRGAIAGTMR